jgi:hypothetical protein
MNWWIWITGEKRLTRQNRSTRGKNGPSATLSTTNPLSIGIRLNAVLRGQRHTGETTRAMARPVYPFIRRFTQMRKVTINFDMLSVRRQQLDSHWKDFHEILYFNIFLKICRENSRFIKIWQKNGYFIISHSALLRMKNVSDKKSCTENQNTFYVQ